MSFGIKTIKILYLILFLITPLIFTSFNSELFELPKMYFVYGVTLIIVILHLSNYLQGKVAIHTKTSLDWPLAIFLTSQVTSTFFSVDTQTSIYGYYSRLNGGLLSLLTYCILYWILSVYLDQEFKKKIIIFSLVSGLVISLYGIAEHFGIDKNIWTQDVQNRVFSTLGQPNWLAAYLCILIPISIDLLLKSKTLLSSALLTFISSSLYLCLLYTKSKSGITAAIVCLALYFTFVFFTKSLNKAGIISLLIIISLTLFNYSPKTSPNPPVTANPTLNITPSGDIRKIVWQGSLMLFRQFPIFGTGPETFAHTYYWVRPASHNLTSEWDFLYNKAHNEYLNYLATTGAFGFLAYILLITSSIYLLVKSKNISLLFSYLTILITNIAGFSVVITSLYFFIIPALVITPKISISKPSLLKKIFAILIILASLFLSTKNLYYYLADITFNQSLSADDSGEYNLALENIKLSLHYRPAEPTYLIKAAEILSKISLTQKTTAFVNQIENLNNAVTTISPFNLNFWKQKAQIYYYLSPLDNKYYLSAIDSLIKATKLAPTDARSFYMLAEFYQNINQTEEAINNYQQAISLKSNYDHAYFALGKIYLKQNNYSLAQSNFQQTLKLAPNNIDAKEYLEFIATSSSTPKSR